MMDFLESTACQFLHWAMPVALRSDSLSRFMSEHHGDDERVKSAHAAWTRTARDHLAHIEKQLFTGYGLPELEMLRVEACSCIIHGHWQAAVCLTNVLLEAFLKLALVYWNVSKPEEKAQPLSRLQSSLSDPVRKYMQMKLNDTISTACAQALIDDDAKEELHKFRKRFRNAFFHADMQSMVGDNTTPVTALDFATQEIEHGDVAVQSLPFLLGEALWQNAEANAIHYFEKVDRVIRDTLPKVFPGMADEQSHGPSNEEK